MESHPVLEEEYGGCGGKVYWEEENIGEALPETASDAVRGVETFGEFLCGRSDSPCEQVLR